MEFSRLLRTDTKILLTKGVSVFRSNDKALLVKYNNKLSKISTGAELTPMLRLFRILQRPRNLKDILNLMPEFKRGDIIQVLHTLHQKNFIKIQSDINKNKFKRKALDPGYFLKDPTKQRKLASVDSRVLLIGDGVLANALAKTLNKMNIAINRIRSTHQVFEHTKKTGNQILVTRNNKISKNNLPSLTASFKSFFDESKLIIATCDYQNIALFELINRICFEKKKAWVRMSFDDNMGYLGPLVIPGKTSCFNCCELRLVTNSADYEYELWRNKDHIPKTGLHVPRIFADFLSIICAMEVLSYLKGDGKTETMDNLILFGTCQPNLTKHKIIRHPNCTYCNSVQWGKKIHSKSLYSPFNATRQSIISKSNLESSTPPENDILERLRKLIDPKTGIILETKKLFADNHLGSRTHYFFYANCSKPLRIGLKGELARPVKLGDRLMDPTPSGSGLSSNEAEMHALMEAIERYSNMFVDESRFIWSSYRGMEKMAINPLEMGLHFNENYVQNNKISKFSADSKIPWIKGHDLYSGKSVFVAADFVHYPPVREKPIVFDNSNGASAHTDIPNAILNGLYEIIERDSFLTMWLNKIPMPIIETKNLLNDFNESIKSIVQYGMDIKLVDLTIDSLVPTVMAVCYNSNPGKFPALVIGTATHHEPEKAMQKALFEVEILLRHYLEKIPERKILDPSQISTLYENGIYYLNPKTRKFWEFMIGSNQISKLSRFTGTEHNESSVMLKEVVIRLHKKGHRVVYVDITPRDIRNLGLIAVKVFVTGYQPMYSGNKLRLNRNRLQESANYAFNSIGAARISTELNSAPHPLA